MGTGYHTEKVTDKPFYCFKLDPDTYEIEKFTINEYWVYTNIFTKHKTYSFDAPPHITKYDKHYSIRDNKFNRFVSGKVFTFNGDIESAIDIIHLDMVLKYDKALIEVQKCETMLDKFMEANKNEIHN